MLARLAVLGGLALAVFADEPSPEARAQAVSLLERAEASVPAASPAIQTSALLHLADTWYALDAKKGAAMADRAFEAALLLPPDERGDNPARLVELLAGTSLEKALLLSRRLPADTEGRAAAPTAVVKALTGAKRVSEAVSLVESLATGGEYPFAAIRSIIEALPGDPAAASTFATAVIAFQAEADIDGLTALLASIHTGFPRETVEPAVAALLSAITGRKDEAGFVKHSPDRRAPFSSVLESTRLCFRSSRRSGQSHRSGWGRSSNLESSCARSPRAIRTDLEN